MKIILFVILLLIIYGVIRNSRRIVNMYINDAMNEEKLERYRRNHYNRYNREDH